MKIYSYLYWELCSCWADVAICLISIRRIKFRRMNCSLLRKEYRHIWPICYGRLPIEDFTYSPNRGFNVGVGTDVNNAGFMAAHFCDEAIHPEYNDFGEEWSIIGKTVINSFVI